MVQSCVFSYEWFSRYALIENLLKTQYDLKENGNADERGDHNSLVHFEQYSI